MLGLFPPSSKVTGEKLEIAFLPTERPVSVPPVKATLSISLCFDRGSPTFSPYPVTTFNTPGGKPTSSKSLENSIIEADVFSEGFTTTVFPAAIAGANLNVVRSSGEFQGANAATTPKGSFKV